LNALKASLPVHVQAGEEDIGVISPYTAQAWQQQPLHEMILFLCFIKPSNVSKNTTCSFECL